MRKSPMMELQRGFSSRLARGVSSAVAIVAVLLFAQPVAMAQRSADQLVVELERLEPDAEVAATVRALLDGIRDEGRNAGAKGRFGAWALEYVDGVVRRTVDTSPRLLSNAASRALAGVLSSAYTDLYRSAALIERADSPELVFAAVDRVWLRIDERVVGPSKLHSKARADLKTLAEQAIVGLPRNPPWAPKAQIDALLSIVDTACSEVEKLAQQARKPNQTSQQDFSQRVLQLSEINERFVAGIAELQKRDRGDGILAVQDPAEIAHWQMVARGYPDSMAPTLHAARSSVDVLLRGSKELSGDELPGLPDRDYRSWLAELAQKQIGLTAAIIGSVVSSAAREALNLKPGESRDADFVWSAEGTPIMACRATIARGPGGFAVVYGPLTSSGWSPPDRSMVFGPYGADVLAGSVLSWSLDATEVAIDPPLIVNGEARYWDGGGRWGWDGGFNDPAPSWMMQSDRVAPLIAASAKTGLGTTGAAIPALNAGFRLLYDFRRSGMRGVTEFARDIAVDLFTDPGVTLIDPVEGAASAARIGAEIRLDVFPLGDASRDHGAKSARDICASAADCVAMRRIVGVDAGTVDAAAAERYSAEALASGERLYAFLLDEADFRRHGRTADQPASNRALERLCRQLGFPLEHPFRRYVDERLQSTTAPLYEGVTRSHLWLRSIPPELQHHRLSADTIGRGQQVNVP